MTELTYSMVGDYNLPNLAMPTQEQEIHIGKFGMKHKKYLEQNRRVKFINLLTSCKMGEYLMQIEQQAQEMMETLVSEMAKSQNVTETLKVQNQMLWVQMMNNIRHSAEEIVLKELIYT